MDVEIIQKNNSTTNIGEYIPYGYSMSTIWGFDNIENKRTLYRGRFMKNFCTYLREHATNVINCEKKKMLPITKEELKSHKKSKSMLYLWKKISKKVC